MSLAEARQRPSARLLVGAVLLGLLAAVVAWAWRDAPQAQPSPAPAPQASAGAQLSGRVMLDAALKARVKPDDTVLIVARLLDGPRTPVAVQKRRASELPLDFKLDDSAATTPTLRLSPSMQLVVAARILRAGQVAAEPGDLAGTAQPVPVGTHGLLIEINGSAP